jgi:flavorubredoxin/flavin reductase (DIM6/NTAB) family NADH-FMN oxidoreductase RutF
MADVKSRDVQVAQIAQDTTVLRSRTWDRLKFEIEYSLQRGTTSNSYWIQAEKTALLDPPGESFTEIYLNELQQHINWQKLDYIILSHVNPNRVATLKALLEWAPHVTLACSRPGAITLNAAFPDKEAQIMGIRGEERLDLGKGHELQFIPTPTPRHPDELCTYDPATKILYTDKFFGVHVCGDDVFDDHWKLLEQDRRFYFECIHASQVRRVASALDKIEPWAVKIYAPAHGPVIRYSLSRLTHDYQQWCQASGDLKVSLLYASAYGNTTTLAQAIAQGLTQSGVMVEAINCELVDPTEITRSVEHCDGFIIGSPTLGGHAPTQIQTALGIVLSTASKTKLAGVFGSYGWSGEAVDLLESKLQDAGYRLGFESLRVKFTPTDDTLQKCQALGAEFAQTLRVIQKQRTIRQSVAEAQVDRTEQAVGRILGSLCVVTARRFDNTPVGRLVGWVSQATFNPPGITVAIPQERSTEGFTRIGSGFVLNILKEGGNLRRYFTRTVMGEEEFASLETKEATNGGVILVSALSYLECTVQTCIECGDHWLVYATVDSGKVLDVAGITAVQHRKSGSSY